LCRLFPPQPLLLAENSPSLSIAFSSFIIPRLVCPASLKQKKSPLPLRHILSLTKPACLNSPPVTYTLVAYAPLHYPRPACHSPPCHALCSKRASDSPLTCFCTDASEIKSALPLLVILALGPRDDLYSASSGRQLVQH
jgi:hypothetical protein